jgi:hypothetical protein
MADTTRLFDELATLFRGVLDAQNRGASTRQLGRAHGYVDGYMKALIDSGIATPRELLVVLGKVRAEAHGPASAECAEDQTHAA